MLSLARREGRTVELRGAGKISSHDLAHLAPQLEHVIETQGKLRALIVLDDFEGWTAGGLVQDMRFHLKHRADFERAAVVSDGKWRRHALRLMRSFVAGRFRLFSPGEEERARAWVDG